LGGVRLWRLRAPPGGAAPQSYHLSTGATVVKTLAFSRDGEKLAAGGETKASAFHEARVWDLRVDGPSREPLVLPGHSASVTALEFTPGNRRLVTGGEDGSIRVWPIDAGKAKEKGQPQPIVLRGHEAAVRALVATGDGLRVASSASDGTVRLWSLEITSQPPIVLTADHEAQTLEIAAGSRFLVGGGEGGVQLWRFNIDDLVALANRIAGRELTDEERRQYSLDASPRIH
jgi:WD40 repeat protein